MRRCAISAMDVGKLPPPVEWKKTTKPALQIHPDKSSMGLEYLYLHHRFKNVNVGKYSIHGAI